MNPLSLKLRGFKGILAGMGVHEVKQDFRGLPPGLIVFYAPNGSGKTTFMNNMHPYRLMPDHVKKNYSPDAFNYYDHCYGNDACKDLLWELDGAVYRSLINIDATRRKQECFLFLQDAAGWSPVNRDGKTETYDKAVDDLLGSPQLFFTSAFRGQEAISLARYSKGTMKELFVEVLAIEGEKAVGDKAGQVHDILVIDLQALARDRRTAEELANQEEAQRKSCRETTESLKHLRAEIEGLEKQIREVQNEINGCVVSLAEVTKSGQEKKRLEAELKEKKKAGSRLSEQLSEKETDYTNRITAAATKLQGARKLVEDAPLLEKQALEKARLEESLQGLKADEKRLSDELDALNRKSGEFATAETKVKEKEKALQQLRMHRNFSIRETQKELDDAKAKAERVSALPCAESEDLAARCPLAADAVATKKTIPAITEKLTKLRTSDSGEGAITTELEKLNAVLVGRAAHTQKINETTRSRDELRKKIAGVEGDVQALVGKLVDLPKIKLTRESLPELESALEALRQEKAKTLDELKARVEALDAEVSGIEERVRLTVVDNTISEKHEGLKKRLGALQEQIETARKNDGESRKTLGVIEEKLRNIEKAKATLTELELRIEHLNGEISEWALLKKAFGMDGIIPLEIADAGPAIATIANELLLAFGGRYSVRIDTQLATADAKSLKEGFDIVVLDALISEEKSLSRLSGGQKTWVEDAITKAICIFNSQKHGKSYRTLFTDEKDGALDALKKREYFQMKREVLRLGGYEREYCITHTPELLAQADAVIMIRDGRIEVSTEPLSIKPDLFQVA